MNILQIIEEFKKDCPCGKTHETAVCDVLIESGAVNRVGGILRRNKFCNSILLVADKNTIKAADGIIESLVGFEIEYKIYENLRVATMKEVNEIEAFIGNRNVSVLSVGTGSLNDICRLACARQNKKFCIFATAPSMDGFASYGAPIVNCGFKSTYPAKSPDVIIADTKILAAAPKELKSAGFGDMIAKYIGLVDWQISALLTNEYYCQRIANLTREAVDELMSMADKVCLNDEYTAGKIFEALLKTGIGMSFAKNSRPASGSEHIIAHLIECVDLREDIIPNFHGDDVGVCTLEMLKLYNRLAEKDTIDTQNETVNWDDVYSFYGEMADDIRKLNIPQNVIDDVDKDVLKNKWKEIRKIIFSIPTYKECETAMKKAGCKITVADIGKNQELFDDCVKYSPYMRKRLTLLRLRDMIK
ncbi:MAG: sn-glycerol-1-phosphate dehydrogenase [Ruminococcaceae bacterium]|nr:sn-glycerol-1-phosphate dehydrogenase [Oscillospiraceae bacterium]